LNKDEEERMSSEEILNELRKYQKRYLWINTGKKERRA